MSVDLTDYKQIEDSHYYINSKGEVFNKKTQKYLKTTSNGGARISINKKQKTFGIKTLLSKLFSNIDFNEYKQIEDSNHFINNKGEVVNKFNEKVKPKNFNGYLLIDINTNKKHKTVYIHRAVAQAFLPNPENLPDVHHKDNNKSNNHLDNLQWTTKSMNCRMTIKEKKSGLPRGVSYNKVAKKYQVQISIDCKKHHLGYYKTVEEAQKKYLEKYKEIMGFECIY